MIVDFYFICLGGFISWWCLLIVWAGVCWFRDGVFLRSWSWTRCLGKGWGGINDSLLYWLVVVLVIFLN